MAGASQGKGRCGGVNKDAKGKSASGADGSSSDPEKEAWEVLAAILLLAGGGYLWWRAGHPIPFLSHNPLRALALPRWLPLAGGAAVTAALAGVVWWAWRWWQRRPARKVLKAFTELGLESRSGVKPKLKKFSREGSHTIRMGFRLPVVASSMGLKRLQANLEEHLDASVRASFNQGLVWIHLGTHAMPNRIDLASFRQKTRPEGELPVGIGITREGSRYADLTKMPHLLVGGTTGGGKSVFLRQALTELVQERSPAQLRLVLADLKGGMEFTLFSRVPHLLCPVVNDVQSFAQAMTVVTEELDRRMELLREAGVESLKAWNHAYPERRMPYVVVVVDELGEITIKSSEREDQVARQLNVNLLSRVARLGRAPGVHMILCTQRPDAEVVPGQIKANLNAILAFRAQDPIQSQILLGQGDIAAALLPAEAPGRAIWKWIDDATTVQTPLLEVSEAKQMIDAVSGTGKQPAPPAPVAKPAEPREVAIGGASTAVSSNGSVPKSQPSLPPPPAAGPAPNPASISAGESRRSAGFDLRRLKLGGEYEFHLRNGRVVQGTVRSIDFEAGRGGANADGEHPLWVSGNGQDHWLSPRDLAQAKRAITTTTAETNKEET